MSIPFSGAVQIANSDADSVFDTSTGALPFAPGTKAIDVAGNEYIFARGNVGVNKGAVCVLTPTPQGGSFAVMNSAVSTGDLGVVPNENVILPKAGVALATPGLVGTVGIAMGYGTQVANLTTLYGWFKVYGEATVQCDAATNTAGTAAYISTVTPGNTTGTAVLANKIAGMYYTFTGQYLTATDGAGNNLARVQLSYPTIG